MPWHYSVLKLQYSIIWLELSVVYTFVSFMPYGTPLRSIVMKFPALLVALVTLSLALHAERSAPFSLSVGTQSVGVRYQFTEDCALVESAEQIAALGSDTLKIAFTPKYVDDYRMEADSEIQSILDLAQKKSSYLEVMDMPFRNIMLWVYPFCDSNDAFYKGVLTEEESQAIYGEIYEFTAFLLERYSGSGKSFFLGNWEGDWHVLREIYDYNLEPEPETIAASIEWFKIREKAVADARRDVAHEDVEVYYYIELNHVAKSMDDNKKSIVNSILPHIKTDYVYWSSYDVTKPAALLGGEQGRDRVFQALDYIEAHLPESDVPGKRVFIGEYGFELASFNDAESQRKYTAAIMKWCLEWGCPFVLYWELYCNEIEPATGEHRGYWLIDDNGDKQPVWFFHEEFLAKANAFVEQYEKEHGKLPCQATYNAVAATWIEDFATYDIRTED